MLLNGYSFTFYGDDQLRKDWKELVGTLLDELVRALAGQELIRFFGLAQSFEKDGKVKMVIEMFGLHFPSQLHKPTLTFLNAPWKLTATGRSPLS